MTSTDLRSSASEEILNLTAENPSISIASPDTDCSMPVLPTGTTSLNGSTEGVFGSKTGEQAATRGNANNVFFHIVIFRFLWKIMQVFSGK